MGLWGATDADESKPKHLTTAEKKQVFATTSGWVREPNNADQGNDNASANPEVLVAIGNLTVSLGAATITSCEFITTAWDARSIWLLKAKLIFYDQSIININLNSPHFSNSNYPVIAPAFAATLVNIIGHWNEIFPKAAFTLMFIPPLILINKFIHNNYFLLTIILIFFIIGKYLTNGELDGLVSIYFVSSAIMFYNLKYINNESYIYCLILIFLNIILTLLKVEGSILLISLIVSSIIIYINNKKILRNIIFVSLTSFIPVLIWNIFCISCINKYNRC